MVLPLRADHIGHRVDDRRADHDAVGRGADHPRLLGGLDAEADADRQVGVALDALDRGRDLARVRQRRAGDAGHRHVVDEARRVLQHLGQPLVVGGGRRQPDEVDAGLQRRDAQLLVHLGRQVDDDQPVDAAVDRVGQEAVDAVDVDRVVVAHQHDRRFIVGCGGIRRPWPASSSASARLSARAGPPPGSPGRRPSGRKTACRAR